MTDETSETKPIPVGRYFYLEPQLDEKLRTTAFRRGILQNDLVVEALRAFLDAAEVEDQKNISTDPVMEFEVDDGC